MNHSGSRTFSAAIALLSILPVLPVTAGQGDANSALSAGRERFERNCGICHGLDGKGGGAFAEILKVNPPDLTVLTRNADGNFPFSDIYNAIDGRNSPLAHGREGMPIWGDRYQQSAEGDETVIRGRVLELILYIEFLQTY